MLKVTFTFCANRESSPQQAMDLFKKHFPGSVRLGYAMRLDNFYRVTCTSEEFCQWIYDRDQHGFVNRMHQLNMRIQYINQLPTNQQLANGPHSASYRPQVGRQENPINYETPNSGMSG